MTTTVRYASNEPVSKGDTYRWQYLHDYAHGGEFTSFSTNERIVFTFGSMQVDIGFRDLGNAIEVDLHQTNCATEDPARAWQHVNCRSC